MPAPALAPVAPKLVKLLPLLSSNQPGEVVATAAAITRTLAGAGLDWHDLVAALEPAPAASPLRSTSDLRTMAEQLRANADMTTAWEASFAESVLDQMKRGRRLSEKQAATLRKIYGERLGGAH